MAQGLSGDLQPECPTSAQLPVLKLLNYKGAHEEAGKLFELTPTDLHLQVTSEITGAKRPLSSNILWEMLTDAVKEGVKEGLGDIVSIEVNSVESSGESYHYRHS